MSGLWFETADLKDIDAATLWAYLDNNTGMNEKQFNLAIKGRRLRPKTKTLLRRILVDNEPRQTLIAEGINDSWLSKTVTETLQNYQAQLERYELESFTVVVHKDKKPFIEMLEADDLDKYVK